MYIVYEITLNDYKYVGCTNDLRRRTNQHNENARKCKSKLGRYLKESEIVLKKKDLKPIAQFEDRHDALMYERKTTLRYARNNKPLLNDNYSNECSRKGKCNNSYMEYYVIDIVEHTATLTKALPKYAKELGITYKSLQDTIRKVRLCANRYKAYYKDKWIDLENKEDYLSGKVFEIEKKLAKEIANKKISKRYLVKTPSGEIIEIENADRFAKEHNLSRGTFHATIIKHNSTKGYSIIKCI